MSEVHQDLESIHNILLGQRQVATNELTRIRESHKTVLLSVVERLQVRIEVIDDLLLEFEAAGVVWPTNVVELCAGWGKENGPPMDTVTFLGRVHPVVKASKHPEDGA